MNICNIIDLLVNHIHVCLISLHDIKNEETKKKNERETRKKKQEREKTPKKRENTTTKK